MDDITHTHTLYTTHNIFHAAVCMPVYGWVMPGHGVVIPEHRMVIGAWSGHISADDMHYPYLVIIGIGRFHITL